MPDLTAADVRRWADHLDEMAQGYGSEFDPDEMKRLAQICRLALAVLEPEGGNEDGWHVAVLDDGNPAHIAENLQTLKNSWDFIVENEGYEPRVVRVVAASALDILRRDNERLRAENAELRKDRP